MNRRIKTFDKIHYPFHELKKTENNRNKGNFFNLIDYLQKPTASVTINGKTA